MKIEQSVESERRYFRFTFAFTFFDLQVLRGNQSCITVSERSSVKVKVQLWSGSGQVSGQVRSTCLSTGVLMNDMIGDLKVVRTSVKYDRYLLDVIEIIIIECKNDKGR